jgi:hypothetical protein
MATSRLKDASALLLAAALVAGGVELGSGNRAAAVAAPMPTRYWAEGELPEMPGSIEVPLGDRLTVNGLPLRISHFTMRASPEAIRSFYERELGRRDLEVRSASDGHGGYVVSALEPASASQIVVAIVARKKRVDVFPSIIPIAGAPGAPAIADDELPFSERAVGVMRVGDGASGSGVVTWQEPALAAEATVARIRDEMGRRGWDLVSEPHKTSGSATALELRRGQRTARFTVSGYRSEPTGAAVAAQYLGADE